jgi:hypothetical protein
MSNTDYDGKKAVVDIEVLSEDEADFVKNVVHSIALAIDNVLLMNDKDGLKDAVNIYCKRGEDGDESGIPTLTFTIKVR